MSIEEYRKGIDRVDEQIVTLIAERIKLAEKIGKEKRRKGIHITDNARETQVLEHIKRLAEQEQLDPADAEVIYRLIIAATKSNEGNTVAFQSGDPLRTNPEGNTMKVAIIGGAGKMGQWTAGFLSKEGHDVTITGQNREKLQTAGKKSGVKTATNITAVQHADAVIISVPIGSFESVVAEIAPYISPGQIVVDITSVKTMPVDAIHKYIKSANVLGIHPLFGPGAKGVANMNFVLTPTNEKESLLAQKVTKFLEARDARVTLMTPQEHDEAMAVILGLAHFIALVSGDTLAGINNLKQMAAISSITFKLLLTLVESVVSEDPGLYSVLQMALPGLPKLEDNFQQKAKAWADIVKDKDKEKFIDRMNVVKNTLEKNSIDFGKAYANMYKLAEWLK
jgi:prephenate dehydrogenase